MHGAFVAQVNVFLDRQRLCVFVGENGRIRCLGLSDHAHRAWFIEEDVVDHA